MGHCEGTSDKVPRRGFEPPLPYGNYALNVARLPVPPPGHVHLVPPAGLEPAPLAPEASALSTELWGLKGGNPTVRHPRQDLNLRPLGPQPNALSTELRGRVSHCQKSKRRVTAGVSRRRRGRGTGALDDTRSVGANTLVLRQIGRTAPDTWRRSTRGHDRVKPICGQGH